MTARQKIKIDQARHVIDQVESLGGAFQVENYAEPDATLFYHLGSAREDPALAERLQKAILDRQSEIAVLISARDWLTDWETPQGSRVQ